MKSEFLKLDLKDLVKGFVLVIIVAILTGILAILQGEMIFTWETLKPVLFSSLAAGISYLLKNILTNSRDVFLQAEE